MIKTILAWIFVISSALVLPDRMISHGLDFYVLLNLFGLIYWGSVIIGAGGKNEKTRR